MSDKHLRTDGNKIQRSSQNLNACICQSFVRVSDKKLAHNWKPSPKNMIPTQKYTSYD